MKRIEEPFYQQPAIELAPRLLGKFICRDEGDNVIKRRITETEAYYGEEDTACHAHKGKTERTKVMYLSGGVSYIYLCYGVHYLFNIVSGRIYFPEAVLIRGIEGYDGPGKLTKALKIDKTLNAENLIVSNKLWLEEDDYLPQYSTFPRVGINYATEKYKNIEWRFKINKN